MMNLRNLDLNLLKAFDVLMDERNVSRAAERLALSQPAMSGTLQRLRESFDDPLFVRMQRGIEPTSRALNLAMPVKQVLQQIETLLQIPEFDPATAEMTLKIACTDYAMQVVVLPFLAKLKPLAPHIRVALLNINENQLPQQLAQRQIDFALTTPAFNAPDMYALNLYREEYVCAVGVQHPLAAEKSLTLTQFCQTEQAIVSYLGGNFAGVTDEALRQLGLSRSVSLSVQNFMILPEILSQQNLLAVVPKRLVADNPQIKTFTPPLAIAGFDKTLVWHARIHQDPAYQWLRQLMKSLF